jgi:hypothetical protein
MGVALEQFKESLKLATSLKKLERDKYPSTPKVTQQPFVKGLRGGAAVLMVAAFEFFLKRLFEESISSLNTVPVTIDFAKLPAQLKVTAVFHGLEKVLKGPLYQARPPKLDRINDVVAACKLIINEQLDPETFSETGSNPNSATVNENFKRVGIPDIFDRIKPHYEAKAKSPVSHDFIKSTLDSIVGSRHVVAHTANTLHISRKTQNDSLKFLQILAELLEKELQKHIKDIKVSAKK